MAIPNGTKFHGVAPNVNTENKGSALANEQRDVYSFPDDFAAGYSYNGIIINMGNDAQVPFNGDTVEWGGIFFISPTTQTSVLAFPQDIIISSVYYKVSQPINVTNNFAYEFVFYISDDLNQNPNDINTWTELGSLNTTFDSSVDGTAPGFIENVAPKKLIVPAGHMLAMAGIRTAGSVTPATAEGILGLVAKPYKI